MNDIKNSSQDKINAFSPIEEGENKPKQVLELPVIDKNLPPVIREIVSNAPANRKLPAFIASLAPLCALATRIRLKYYYDSRPSALLLQVLIEGNQSVGKSFAADIERLIMDKTIKALDKEQRRLEQEYREKKRRRKANEKLEEEPQTTIRVIPPTISKTVLVKRADFYERNLGDVLTFWMFAEELAQVTDAGKQGYSNLRTIMRTAYDFGSLFGMDFASDNSYSAIVDINICSMFCTTPSALDEYMDRKAIEGGNITRCILCQLNDQLGSDGAIFKPYSEKQQKIIDKTLKSIMNDTYTAKGTLKPTKLLDMSWIDTCVRSWCRQKGHESILTGSNCIDVFRKRSSVSAFRVAALCYYLYQLEGMADAKAKKYCKQIYLFMAEYIIQALIKRWGKTFEDLNAKRYSEQKTSHDPGIFALLNDDFTRDQLKQLVQQQGRTTPARMFIYMWQQSGDIISIDKDHFRKVKPKKISHPPMLR
jgi:hypothetical protein